MAGRGHRTPEGYDASAFPSFAVTVDVVILTMLDGRLHVLLVRRQADPYAGAWALPGGFKRTDETLDEAAARELREETGVVAPSHLAQFGAYGDPGRDPRRTSSPSPTSRSRPRSARSSPAPTPTMRGCGPSPTCITANSTRLRPPPDPRRRHRARRRASSSSRPRHGLRRPDLHAVGAAERVRGELGTTGSTPPTSAAACRRRHPPAAAPAIRTMEEPVAYVEATGERAHRVRAAAGPPELFRAGDGVEGATAVRRPRSSRPAGRATGLRSRYE